MRCFTTLTTNSSHTNTHTTVFTFLEGVSTGFVLTSQHYRGPSLSSFLVCHVHRRHYTNLRSVGLGSKPGALKAQPADKDGHRRANLISQLISLFQVFSLVRAQRRKQGAKKYKKSAVRGSKRTSVRKLFRPLIDHLQRPVT